MSSSKMDEFNQHLYILEYYDYILEYYDFDQESDIEEESDLEERTALSGHILSPPMPRNASISG